MAARGIAFRGSRGSTGLGVAIRVSMPARRVPSLSGDTLLVLASPSGDAAMEGRGGGRGGRSWFYNMHDMDKQRVRIH